MWNPTELTIKILQEIRDEIKGTNTRLDKLEQTTNERFGEVNERFEALEQRIVDSEVRVSTAIIGVASALEDVKTLLRENCSSTLKDHERRITLLENRIGD